MTTRRVRQAVLVLTAVAAVLSAVNIGSATPGCAVQRAVLCGGSDAATAQRTATFLPTVERLATPLPTGLAGISSVVTTCRFTATTHATGSSSPEQKPWSTSVYAVDDQQGAYAIARTFAAYAPRSVSAWSQAEAGVTVVLRNWPQPSSVTVTYPWHVRGTLDADADVRGSSTKAAVTVDLVLKQGDIPASTRIVDDSIASTFGPQTKNVRRDGTNALTVNTPSNLTYKGFIRVRPTSETNLSWSGAAASASATSSFWPKNGGVYTDHQDWHFNLPPGWTITSCGGGVPIKG